MSSKGVEREACIYQETVQKHIFTFKERQRSTAVNDWEMRRRHSSGGWPEERGIADLEKPLFKTASTFECQWKYSIQILQFLFCFVLFLLVCLFWGVLPQKLRIQANPFSDRPGQDNFILPRSWIRSTHIRRILYLGICSQPSGFHTELPSNWNSTSCLTRK